MLEPVNPVWRGPSSSEEARWGCAVAPDPESTSREPKTEVKSHRTMEEKSWRRKHTISYNFISYEIMLSCHAAVQIEYRAVERSYQGSI
eukprot:SAG31_NODE_32442_length_356_cov_0.529183_1_plen_88_part_10